ASSPSDLTLADIDASGGLDIVVSNPLSGEVSVLRNQGGGAFAPAEGFRAGVGLYGVERAGGRLRVRSQERTAGVVAGAFNGAGVPDLLAANSGSHSLVLLAGKEGAGDFVNPQRYAADSNPTVVRTADFDHDGRADLAVLNQASETVSVFTPDDHGGLT